MIATTPRFGCSNRGVTVLSLPVTRQAFRRAWSARMACDRSDLYKPIRSNIDNPLRSPGLRHLAWNVGERLGVSLAKRAVFIKSSFPHELENATLEYLKLNLRDQVPSQIPIDVPDKGDYRFHLETDNSNSD